MTDRASRGLWLPKKPALIRCREIDKHVCDMLLVNQLIGFGAGGSSDFSATGGSKTTSGSYQLHTFTSSGNFVLTNTGKTINWFIVGGGNNGLRGDAGYGPAGGSGGQVQTGSSALASGTYAVVVGGVGGNSSFNGTTASGGGGAAGGAATSYYADTNGNPGSNGTLFSLDGVYYGASGGGGASAGSGSGYVGGAGGTSGGGKGGDASYSSGTPGDNGSVYGAGGGSGGFAGSGSYGSGGSGVQGVVFVYYLT